MKNFIYVFLMLGFIITSCEKESETIDSNHPDYHALLWDTAQIKAPIVEYGETMYKYQMKKDTTLNLEELLINPKDWSVRYSVTVFANSKIIATESDLELIYDLGTCPEIETAEWISIYAGAYNGSAKPYLHIEF